jgi:hypothetical protein
VEICLPKTMKRNTWICSPSFCNNSNPPENRHMISRLRPRLCPFISHSFLIHQTSIVENIITSIACLLAEIPRPRRKKMSLTVCLTLFSFYPNHQPKNKSVPIYALALPPLSFCKFFLPSLWKLQSSSMLIISKT